MNSNELSESEHEMSIDEVPSGTETNDEDTRMSFDEFYDPQNNALNESQESEDVQHSIFHSFNQDELSDLVRDAGLSKEISELIASRLQEKNCLVPGTRVTFYRNCDHSFRKFFSKAQGLVYCNNIEGLRSMNIKVLNMKLVIGGYSLIHR